MSPYNTKYHDMALLGQNPNPGDYFFIAQGVLTVAGMDDKEEMQVRVGQRIFLLFSIFFCLFVYYCCKYQTPWSIA